MSRSALIAAVQRLCIALWVGGAAFFAFILAPVAFRTLSDRHAAGLVVGAALRGLHWVGLVAGLVFLAAALSAADRKHATSLRVWQIVSVTLMLGLTAFSQFYILPRMDSVRDISGSAAPAFQSLHQLSVFIEGTVLLLGLVLAATFGVGAARTGRPR